MASFTNFATLIYNGGTSNSNTVTGELLETLTLTKTAASSRYTARDNVTYVLSLVNGGTTPLTAQATLAAAQRADLTVSKAICPATVTESGQLTYTFVLQNFGNTAATAGDNVILTDTFDPALTGLTVTYNGDAWTEGDNYTYDAATGTFATIAGQITVPAATYTQETDGTYTVTPGTTTVTVTGTV